MEIQILSLASTPQSAPLQQELWHILSDSGFTLLPWQPAHSDLKSLAMLKEGLKHRIFPLLLSGNRACMPECWRTIAESSADGLGLLWMDPRMDGSEKNSFMSTLLNERTGLAPENVCLFGARNFVWQEENWLEARGAQVITNAALHERGFEVCFSDAYHRLKSKTKRWGLRLSLDLFDPQEIAAVQQPCADGLWIRDVRACLRLASRDPNLVAIEISGYDPAKDRDRKSFVKIALLLEEMLWSRLLVDSKHLILQ